MNTIWSRRGTDLVHPTLPTWYHLVDSRSFFSTFGGGVLQHFSCIPSHLYAAPAFQRSKHMFATCATQSVFRTVVFCISPHISTLLLAIRMSWRKHSINTVEWNILRGIWIHQRKLDGKLKCCLLRTCSDKSSKRKRPLSFQWATARLNQVGGFILLYLFICYIYIYKYGSNALACGSFNHRTQMKVEVELLTYLFVLFYGWSFQFVSLNKFWLKMFHLCS